MSPISEAQFTQIYQNAYLEGKQELVKWLEKRKRNTYLPLEEPCEWVAFSLDDWQALCRTLSEEEQK